MGQQARIIRVQRLDLGRATPAIVDEKFPTQPLRISNFGHGTATLGVGSAWLMGSRRIQGSPDDIMYNLTYMHFITNTPNIFFAITHSRGTPRAFGATFPGTLKVIYLESKGELLAVGDVMQPLETFPPGTVRLYCLGPGSSKTSGKGSPPNIQGLGSPGRIAVGAELIAYPI
jgi:hypothetical protein